MAKGHLRDAAECFRQILRANPTHLEAHRLLNRLVIDGFIFNASSVRRNPMIAPLSAVAPGPRPELKIGVAWCTEFARRTRWTPSWWSHPSLPEVGRGPVLFAGLMRERSRATVEMIALDEKLEVGALDGTSGRVAESVDLFYLATHGEFKNQEYFADLHAADWSPTISGLGAGGPAVAV